MQSIEVWDPLRDVLTDCAVEKRGLLLNEGDLLAVEERIE